jgi:hypothetical protein
MPDYSLDISVAQAVEPMPPPPSIPKGEEATYVIWSPMKMWIWNVFAWQAGTFQDSIAEAMRAYELYFLRTGWTMNRLEHFGVPEDITWQAVLYKRGEGDTLTAIRRGYGSTAAIAICEAIKASSLADAEAGKTDAVGERG